MEKNDVEIIETEKEGISIGDIFKRIWHAKITLGVSFVAVLVAGVVAIHYGYTKPKETFSGSVVYRFTGAENGTYPDGSTFDYRSIASQSNLQSIKDSNESYANIDIETMVEKNAVSVSLAPLSGYNDQGEQITYEQSNHILINCPASYFDSTAQGQNFLRDVLLSPSRKAAEKVDSIYYTASLDLANVAVTYQSQISYLIAQRDYIINSYSNLISVFGQGTPVQMQIAGSTTSITLSQVVNYINQYFETNNLSTLSNEATRNYYLKTDENGEFLESALSSLEVELQQAEYDREITQKLYDESLALWKELYSNISNTGGTIQPDSALSQQIAGYRTTLSSLDERIAFLRQLLGLSSSDAPTETPNGKAAPEEFINHLNSITTELETYSQDLKTNTTYLYNNELETYSDLPNYVEMNGGLSIILNAAISFVLAVIVACLIAGIKGNIDIKKEEQNKNEVSQIENANNNWY